jgi:PmbA protein
MSAQSLLEIARHAVALAQAKGAQGASASAARAREVSVDWRDGRLEKITEATTRGVGLQLYVDGRYSAVSTSDLRPEALEKFIGDAVAMARALAVDPFRLLPDPKLYEDRPEIDLQLADDGYHAVTADQRKELAAALEAAARAQPGSAQITSVTSSASDTFHESARVVSNGFVGERRGTMFSASVDVSVRDPDGRRPEEGHSASSRHLRELPGAEEIGRIGAARALGRIGSQKMPSVVLPMVVENRVAGGLLGRFLAPAAASLLQQRRSFLDSKLGKPIASPLLDLVDDPLVVRGLGSRLYDGEGISAKRMPLVEAGILKNYYVDTYYGRKAQLAPTTGSASNLAWKLGDRSARELIAQARDGVYVTGFLGGNSNTTTGDFSLGVQGFRIRGGQLAEPVGEMNVAGNQLELWKRLVAVGNDPYRNSTARTPTLVFEGVQFAGV